MSTEQASDSPAAVFFKNSKAHGTQYAMYPSDKSDKSDESDFSPARSIGSAPVFASLRRGKQSAAPANKKKHMTCL